MRFAWEDKLFAIAASVPDDQELSLRKGLMNWVSRIQRAIGVDYAQDFHLALAATAHRVPAAAGRESNRFLKRNEASKSPTSAKPVACIAGRPLDEPGGYASRARSVWRFGC